MTYIMIGLLALTFWRLFYLLGKVIYMQFRRGKEPLDYTATLREFHDWLHDYWELVKWPTKVDQASTTPEK